MAARCVLSELSVCNVQRVHFSAEQGSENRAELTNALCGQSAES
jgi:hypothetical protein